MCVSRSEFNLQLEEASGKCVLPRAQRRVCPGRDQGLSAWMIHPWAIVEMLDT